MTRVLFFQIIHPTLFADFFISPRGNLAITHYTFFICIFSQFQVHCANGCPCNLLRHGKKRRFKNDYFKQRGANRPNFRNEFSSFFSITRTLNLAKPSLIILFHLQKDHSLDDNSIHLYKHHFSKSNNAFALSYQLRVKSWNIKVYWQKL